MKTLSHCENENNISPKKRLKVSHISSNFNYKMNDKLNIHIVEEHNQALNAIYNEIGRKNIKFDNLTLIHFDSHPDLGLPSNILADSVFNKHELLDNLSIENWILPAFYAGHLSVVIWLKPKWSKQIDKGFYEFYIGKDISSGLMKVDCKLDYYLSELLYTPKENLVNRKLVKLYVSEIDDILNCFNNENTETCIFPGLKDILSNKDSKSIILDIDLDYFSTLDPFKNMFLDETAYNTYQNVYLTPIPDLSENFDDKYKVFYQEKLIKMNKIHNYLKNNNNENKEIFIENAELVKSLDELQKIIKKLDLDLDIIHSYGECIDKIGLPDHKSSDSEIQTMIEEFSRFIEALPGLPGVVTIARSSLDDYCPADQVDFIQNEVIKRLKNRFFDKINSINLNY